MILKKSWFSDLKVLQMCGYINKEEYQQSSQTRIKTLNSEKQESLKRKERQTLRPCPITEKTVNHETNCGWRTWNSPQKIEKRIGIVGNRSFLYVYLRVRPQNKNYSYIGYITTAFSCRLITFLKITPENKHLITTIVLTNLHLSMKRRFSQIL